MVTMKKLKYVIAAFCAVAMVSCGDTIEVGGSVDESKFDGSNKGLFLRDADSSSTEVVAEFYGNQTALTNNLSVGLPKAATNVVSGTVALDADYLAEYNAKNKTGYTMLPAAQVSIAGNGAFTVETGKSSAGLAVTMTLAGEIATAGTTYAVALSITPAAGVGADSHVIYLVRDQRALPTCDKGSGKPKAIVMYDGGNNPLNALEFELENGKLLWDIVCVFASNINWDASLGRVISTTTPRYSGLTATASR